MRWRKKGGGGKEEEEVDETDRGVCLSRGFHSWHTDLGSADALRSVGAFMIKGCPRSLNPDQLSEGTDN